MTSNDEELQAKEFLKRAEVRTMKKDLRKMREADALKERGKIVNFGKSDAKKALESNQVKEQENNAVTKVFLKKTNEELEAENQLKTYANEEERQKIFLLENQKKEIEAEIAKERKEKEPNLALEKNELILAKKQWEDKIKAITKEEETIEEEQNFISNKEKTANVAKDKEALEQKRWALEEKRQETEKKRWEIEKGLQTAEEKIKTSESGFENLINDENVLEKKLAEIENSLKLVYADIIKRVEDEKKGKTLEQQAEAEERSKTLSQEKENIQRQQHSKSYEAENEQRKKFLENIEKWSKEKDKK